MDQTKQDSSNTLNSVEENQNKLASSKIVTNEEIEDDNGGTGIRLIGTESGGYAASISKILITDWKETEEEVLEEVSKKGWKIIMTVILAMVEVREQEIRKIIEKNLPITEK